MKTIIITLTLGFVLGVASFKPLQGYFNPAGPSYDTKSMAQLSNSLQDLEYIDAREGR